MTNISHCLWFDSEAEDVAKFYTSVFKGGKILNISRYGKEGFEIHGQPEGKVMVAEFEILGQKYMALNGGPIFKHSEAFSIVVTCDTQEEIDYYWDKLREGKGQEVECGWLKDQFGVSWQVTPRILGEMLTDRDPAKVQRVTAAFLKMKKFDIAALRRAYEGKS
jgi:predicted 3-demethylubiquinone-9 3-methyltransferase (glyoxalase superfamily)